MLQIDSSKALNIVWFGWKSIGIFLIPEYSTCHIFYMTLSFISINFYSVIVFVTQLFFVTDLQNLLDNLPMNVIVITGIVKFTTILIKRRQILGINESLAQLDGRLKTTEQAINVKNLNTFCNRFVVIGIISYALVDITAAVDAAFSNRQKLLFEIWLPYDWRASAIVYWLTFAYQTFTQNMLALQHASYDLSGPMYLVVLKAHLQIIMDRIQSLKYRPYKNEDENLKELIACIEDHRLIIKIYDVLQGTVSYIIFCQFIATAIVMVMLVLNYLFFSPGITEIMAIGFFFLAEILQILPCCYYSNEFMWTTDQMVTSLYSCDWYNHSPKFKKTMIIFMQMTQRPKVIVAGKIIPVTLGTFASVMKLSYSLLTVAQRVRH